jgi:ADP-heptose:LPS heptosyltransferase
LRRQRLLVIHQGALGDFVVTFPVLEALRRAFSNIEGICRTSFGRLAREIGVMDRSHPLEAARFASLYTSAADRRVRVMLEESAAVLLFSFSNSLAQSLRKGGARSVVRIDPWPPLDRRVHVTEFLAKAVAVSGLVAESELPVFQESLVRRRTADVGGFARGSRIIVSPGAGSVRKRWPLEHFLSVADRLHERGYSPAILLGPAEKDLKPELLRKGKDRYPVVEPEGLAALARVLQATGGYIGNDSGVSHLAGYLGLPTVAVFGPSDPIRWCPFGANVRCIGASTECSPCFESGATNCKHVRCLEEIPAQRVLDAVEAFCNRADRAC